MRVKYIKNRKTETPDAKFPVHNPRKYLKIGGEYNVYGILYLDGDYSYLIDRESTNNNEYSAFPSWEPAELFQIVNAKLPDNWYFSRFLEIIPKEKLLDPLSTICGYKELALDRDHNDKLLDRDYEHIKIFTKRKKEMDIWEEQCGNT